MLVRDVLQGIEGAARAGQGTTADARGERDLLVLGESLSLHSGVTEHDEDMAREHLSGLFRVLGVQEGVEIASLLFELGNDDRRATDEVGCGLQALHSLGVDEDAGQPRHHGLNSDELAGEGVVRDDVIGCDVEVVWVVD